MLSDLRNTLCFVLAALLTFAPALPAQQTSAPPAPIPADITTAQAVFVSNGGGSNYFSIFTGGADRGYNTLYHDLQTANRYQLVGSPSEAQLIFEIRSVAPAESGPHDTVAYNPQLILSIIDPKTHAVLWTTSANVRAIGLQKRRDREFDASVAILLDKLSEVTGQPLTPQQIKAVNNNSRLPTAAKVFIVAALAVAVGMTTYGIYRVTHPPTLPPLPNPGQPALP
ncbi:MAG TPA: hypothetical protein VIY53_00915 [Acidobacteriaceae bacterium]